MRAVLVLLVLSPAAFADPVEVDLAGGYGEMADSSVGAPVVSVRAGPEIGGFFSPGVRVTGFLGPEGSDVTSGGPAQDRAANRGWSILADARFHTPGRIQGLLDLGVGLGRLIRAQGSIDEASPTVGDVSAAFQIGIGVRAFVGPSLALGVQLIGPIWTGTHLAAPVAQFSRPEQHVVAGAALCGSVTFHFGS